MGTPKDKGETVTKTLDLYLSGRPIKDAMIEGGYSELYAEKIHKDWLGLPAVADRMKAMVGAAAGIGPERWDQMMKWAVEHQPPNGIPWLNWFKGMEMIGYGLGRIRRDAGKTPTVPINIHIHREREPIIDIKREDTRVVQGEPPESR